MTVEPSYVEVPERPTERRRLATKTDVQSLKQTKNHRVQESSPTIRHNHTGQMSLSTSLHNTHLRHHRHHSHRKDSAAVRWVFLLASGRREIDPSKSEWSTAETREKFSLVQKTEVDMLIQDKQALLPLSAQQSSEVPRERIIPSRLIFVNEVGQSSQTSSVTARMTAQGDQDLMCCLSHNESSDNRSDSVDQWHDGRCADHCFVDGRRGCWGVSQHLFLNQVNFTAPAEKCSFNNDELDCQEFSLGSCWKSYCRCTV